MTKGRSKVETVVLAVCLLGGEKQFVDIEDIAAAANNLAPGLFTWKRYPDQIDIDSVKRCLLAASRPVNGNLVTGSSLSGWALTERGTEFAKDHEEYNRGGELLLTGITEEESRFMSWQRKRIQAHKAFRKVVAGLDHDVTFEEATSFFLLDSRSVPSDRKRKIEQYIKYFGNDPTLGPVVRTLALKVGGM